MKVLDLFSGIGGFSLGLERAGMETVAFCEIEDYPVSILNKHWPNVPVHRDIRKLDGRQYYNKIDLLCGGFPCQPFSVAGQQKGKEDDRHLWPEMLRIIKESRPTWVIGENVAGFIKMALDDVLLDLETEGYTTQSFVIPACAVGGIHRRDRVWIVAYRESKSSNGSDTYGEARESQTPKPRNCNSKGVSSNSEHNGWHGSENGQGNTKGNVRDSARTEQVIEPKGSSCSRGDDANAYDSESVKHEFKPIGIPTQPRLCGAIDGVSRQLVRGLNDESNASEKRPAEILSAMLKEDGAEKVWKEAGGFNALQIKEILLSKLYGVGENVRESNKESSLDASKEVQEVLLQALRCYRKAINTSCGWGLEEQQSEEFNDSLQFVSHHIASFAGRYEFKWIKLPTESPVVHKEDSVPDRMARLKALGNTAVPQIPELFGRAILEVSR